MGTLIAYAGASIGWRLRLSQNEQVDEALQRAGIDISRIHRDLNQHGAEIESLLTRNSNEAQASGIRGTPGIQNSTRVLKRGAPPYRSRSNGKLFSIMSIRAGGAAILDVFPVSTPRSSRLEPDPGVSLTN